MAFRANFTVTVRLLVLAYLAWGGVAWADQWVGGTHPIRWSNGLRTEDLRFNALSANPRANPRMVEVPLSTATYNLQSGDPILREQLEDPAARAFFGYVVSCALSANQQVQWQDGQGNAYQWQGRLGLCPGWAQGPASVQCQRWVSACVLARNNAEGRRVLISGRGQHPASTQAFSPQPQVSVDPYLPGVQVPTASALPCQVPEQGVHRNCGFRLEYVGQCQPGQQVQVGAGGVPVGAACGTGPLGQTLAGTAVLRVCSGLHACNAATALAQSEGTCGSFLPAVAFTCPASGAFSVLSAPFSSTQAVQVQVAVSGATYPASESQLFSVREGAFFGNLFGPGALAPGVDVHVAQGVLHRLIPAVAGSVYPKMYACHDPGWTAVEAWSTSRLCTQPGVSCVAQPLGACNATVQVAGYVGLRCQLDNVGGSGGYGQCQGLGEEPFTEVVTPWLNQPCDVVGNPSACLRAQ